VIARARRAVTSTIIGRALDRATCRSETARADGRQSRASNDLALCFRRVRRLIFSAIDGCAMSSASGARENENRARARARISKFAVDANAISVITARRSLVSRVHDVERATRAMRTQPSCGSRRVCEFARRQPCFASETAFETMVLVTLPLPMVVVHSIASETAPLPRTCARRVLRRTTKPRAPPDVDRCPLPNRP
jgi:hypothetical protein